MTLDDFKESISEGAPPAQLPSLLQALWHDRKGDWEKAHQIAQDIATRQASWVHAYLHRKEGDLANAGYWYRRAGREVSKASLEQEWEQITSELLAETAAARG